MRLFKMPSQQGSSDTGIIMTILGLAVVLAIGVGIVGWIGNIKDARDSHSIQREDDKPVTDPYHEPGAFQVTF